MSTTADAVHCSACTGSIEIANCIIEGQGDDGYCTCYLFVCVHAQFVVLCRLNIQSNYLDVEAFFAPNQIKIGKNGVVQSFSGSVCTCMTASCDAVCMCAGRRCARVSRPADNGVCVLCAFCLVFECVFAA